MPAITPNSGPVAVAAFVPTSISGCALWIDGADTSATSMTLSGSNVTQWNDKSGNGNNFTLGSTYIRQNSLNGRPSVYFNGSNYMSNGSLSVNSSNHTGFIIALADNITGTSIGYSANLAGIASFVTGSMSSEDSGAFSYRYYVNYGGLYSAFDIPSAGFRIYTQDITPYSPTIICEQFQNGTAGLFLNGSVPGYLNTQPTMPSGFANTSGCLLGLQWMGSAQRYYQGYINEMIMFNSVLSISDRQKVEGYLAQKWGLTASLPPGHPGLTANYAGSQPRVFRLGPLPGTRTPFLVTANQFVPPPVYTLTVIPDARYSFLTAPSGTITNTGSSGSIGAATIVSATYTATSPSYITFARGTGYILAPSIAGIQTLILIVKIRDATSPSYLLDARSGLANGWLYTGGPPIGPDWTSATYYRDAVNTTFSGDFITPLQDSTWHHICLQRASFTSAITFLARFSQNETLGCDCGEIMIFTGALIAQQVKENYNFFSGRFGWTPVQ
jgi:hypothetical protein